MGELISLEKRDSLYPEEEEGSEYILRNPRVQAEFHINLG